MPPRADSGTASPLPKPKRMPRGKSFATLKPAPKPSPDAHGESGRPTAAALMCKVCGTPADPKGANWAISSTTDRGQTVCLGDECSACWEFASIGPYENVEGLLRSRKDSKEARAQEIDMQEFLQSKKDMKGRKFPKEGVDFVIANGSRLEERRRFCSRQAFREAYNMWPEDAKLDQIRVTGIGGEEVTGVLLDTDEMPELVTWTEKVWLKTLCKMQVGDGLYARQAARIWDVNVQAFQANYGQNMGGKYMAKHRTVRAYTETEMQEAVNKAEAKAQERQSSSPSGMAQLTGKNVTPSGKLTGTMMAKSADIGMTSAGDEMDDGKPEECEVNAAEPAMSGVAASSTEPPVPAPPMAVEGGHVYGGGGNIGDAAMATGTSSLKRLGTFHSSPMPSKQRKLGGSPDDTVSLATSGGADTDRKCRVKPAGYWLAVLPVEGALAGKKYVREFAWAEDCVDRSSRSSNGTDPEVHRLELRIAEVKRAIELHEAVSNREMDEESFTKLVRYFTDQQFDFPSEFKQLLVARRLMGVLDSIHSGVDPSAVNTFVKVLNPFVVTPQPPEHDDATTAYMADDPLGLRGDGGVSADFDGLVPCLNQLDGVEADRVRLARTVFVYDVLKVLIAAGSDMARTCKLVCKALGAAFEDAVALLAEVTAEAEETLTICRGLSALLDVNIADSDYLDAAQSFQSLYKSSATGAVADVSVYLHASPYYKDMLDDFLKFLPGARQGMACLAAERARIQAVDMSLAKFVPIAMAACRLSEKSLATMRPGSTRSLDLALQAKLEEQHHRLQGMVAGGMGFTELAELPALVELLGVARRLWPSWEFLVDMAEWASTASSKCAEQAMWDCLIKAMQDSKSPDGSYNDIQLARVKKLVTDCEGKTPEASIHSELLGWLTSFAEHLQEHFPGGDGHLCILVSGAALLKEGGEALVAMSTALNHLREVIVARDAIWKLGPTVAAQCNGDADYKLAKTFLQKKAVFDQTMADSMLCFDPGSNIDCLILDLGRFLKELGVYAVEAAHEALDDLIMKLKPTAAGGQEERPWHDGIPETAEFDEVLAHAQASILKLPAADFLNNVAKLQVAENKYTIVAGLFGEKIDSGVVASSVEVRARLRVSVSEGVLLHLFLDTQLTAVQVKAKVYKIRTTTPPALWDRVFTPVLTRAVAAERLRKTTTTT